LRRARLSPVGVRDVSSDAWLFGGRVWLFFSGRRLFLLGAWLFSGRRRVFSAGAWLSPPGVRVFGLRA